MAPQHLSWRLHEAQAAPCACADFQLAPLLFHARSLLARSPLPPWPLADPALAKDIGVRQFTTFHDRPPVLLAMAAGRRLAAIRAGMVLATGPYWASVRAAAQPLFHTAR